MVVKRSISRGSPFNSRNLRLPTTVHKGDIVEIVASTQGLMIRMRGKALNSGAKGERIRVKNQSSKKTIEAVVVDANTVTVNL